MDSYGIDHHFDCFKWPNLFVSRSFQWKLPWCIRVFEAKATLLPKKPKLSPNQLIVCSLPVCLARECLDTFKTTHYKHSN